MEKKLIAGILLCALSGVVAACASPDLNGQGKPDTLTAKDLHGFEERSISSVYFDRAMHYKGSLFRAISLERLVGYYDPQGLSDGILLDCFDDYQGIVSVEDIKKYDLQLATQIELAHGSNRPDWLQPLFIVVPDGVNAPFQERFMTANIRSLRFVKLGEYYAPLEKIAGADKTALSGLNIFKDNCLFCHSLMGIGGNKGGALPEKFDFSRPDELARFESHFKSFHHKDNPDKQNIDQFVSGKCLKSVGYFLGRLSEKK